MLLPRVAVAGVGCRWLMNPVGSGLWLLLAAVRCWFPLAVAGSYSLLLAVIGCCRLLLLLVASWLALLALLHVFARCCAVSRLDAS